MFGTPLGPQGPPFRLPGQHFTAALVFLAAAVVGTVWIAPDLAAGAFASGRVVAVTHLFTLGWIATSIMGVLTQFLPVALGEPIRSERLAHVTFGLHVTGVPAFVAGLAWSHTGGMLGGAALVGAALAGFAVNLVRTLVRVERRDLTWWCLTGSTVFLFLTVLFGLAHAGNLRWGYLGTGRFVGLGVHVHVALLGWVLLLFVGVSAKLLPMFLTSDESGEAWARLAAVGLAGGAGALVLFHHGPPPLGRWLPAALLGVGVAGTVVQVGRWYRYRPPRDLDPGLRLVVGATGVLAIGVALAAVGRVVGPGRLPTAWVAAFVLGLTLLVAGHYFKIIPFLVWYHRFGPVAGTRPVPRVTELYSRRWASAAGLFLLAGTLSILTSIVVGSETGLRLGAGLLAVGAGLEVGIMAGLARTRPDP